MNRVTRVLLRGISRLGGVRILRFVAEVFELKKLADGGIGFPFVKRRRSKSAQILIYHRVNDENDPIFPGVPTKTFARQMEYVAEHYTVCSLNETVGRIRSDDVPDRLLAITFDDGYRDNYTNAFPVLNKLSLPATIFLATDAIDSGRVLWHDRVFSALRTTKAKTLEEFGDNGGSFPLGTAVEKRLVLAQALKFLWSLDDHERSLQVERLAKLLGISESASCNNLMLGWDDIRFMSHHGVGFGAHTVTHPILSKLSACRLRREIRESKATIEAHLNAPVKHFAYPVGRREDFTENVKDELRDAGFECAVTTIFGANDSKQDLFELRRATPWNQDIDSFALRLNYFKFAS
jgi:peptidoglycan/xylan/chitin deacetylase (PgdA/CDA1 family)